ncbi:Protein kinase-like domain protein [Niveomyces insectorum RCEF 264]|uniref:non-specific serine/threonine protein kinase n=1 Tax=Niveomyces insectorum RCEF 264 TaxID=1081102 RepID=A0A167SK54_9HYPO|nr:Protein kinase-like domain protein [Niveomyces insectorum RCEF 264]
MSVSPPPTPPPRPPERGERRFKRINTPCEWVEDYYPGSYHPVDVGDTIYGGRYKVIRKLGYGSFSTVWLVHDLDKANYVAVKILVAKASEGNGDLQEEKIYRHLSRPANEQTTVNRYITQLLDTFVLKGPNGEHKCMVFEPMGPTANTMVEELPEFNPQMYGMKVRYPVWMAKQILRGALEALQFLHAQGIAHGDFQPGNILFPLRAGGHGHSDGRGRGSSSSCLDGVAEATLWQTDNANATFRGSISPPVVRLDGKVDRWAPKHLYVPQPLTAFTDYGPGFRVKLSDLGGAYFVSEPPDEIVTPTGLSAPELIFQKSVPPTVDGRMLDIWSVGCLVFELVTGCQLFCIPYSMREDADDSHLLSLSHILGPLPDHLFARWPRSSLYFTTDNAGKRTLFNRALGGVGPGQEPLILPTPTMEDMFDEAAPEVGSTAEAQQIKSLVRRILQYDPSQRPTAAEILQDPWFAEAN